MTKRELVETLSKELNYSKKEVERILDKITSTVIEKVKGGEKVAVTGFGTFDLGRRAQRRGRDPQTGDYITIPSMNMPRFRAGKRFKEMVRK